MNRIASAVLFLSMTAFLVGCNKRSDQPLTAATQSQPESTPAPQAAASTTVAVADSCFNASTQSKEQDRIELATAFKEGESEHGVDDLTWRAMGDAHEQLIIFTQAPSWSPQVQTVAQKWSTEWRQDWFKPKLEKAVCDAGFAKVKIAVLIPKPRGVPDIKLIYVASVTKGGFVRASATH